MINNKQNHGKRDDSFNTIYCTNNKMNEININNDFFIDYVSYGDIFEMTKKNIVKNPHYLLSKREDMYSG